MVKKGNERIILTLPEKQVAWLRKMAKKAKITPSEYIKWILCRKAEELVKFLHYTEADDLVDLQEVLDDEIEIIKTPWVPKN